MDWIFIKLHLAYSKIGLKAYLSYACKNYKI